MVAQGPEAQCGPCAKGVPLDLWPRTQALGPTAVLLCAFPQGSGQWARGVVLGALARFTQLSVFPLSPCRWVGPLLQPSVFPIPWAYSSVPTYCILSDLGLPFSFFDNHPPSPQMESFLGAAEAKPGVIITHTRNNPESCWAHIRA